MSQKTYRRGETAAALAVRQDCVRQVNRAAADLDRLSAQSHELIARSRRLLDATNPQLHAEKGGTSPPRTPGPCVRVDPGHGVREGRQEGAAVRPG